MISVQKRKVFNGYVDTRDGHPSEWIINNELHIPPICSNKSDVDHYQSGHKVKIIIEWDEVS